MRTYDEVVGVGEGDSPSSSDDDEVDGVVELSDVFVGVSGSSLVEDEEVGVEVGTSSEEVGVEDVESVGDSGASSDSDGESVTRGPLSSPPAVKASPRSCRFRACLWDPLTATARKRERSRIVKAEGHRMMGDRYQRCCYADGRRWRCQS